MNPASLLIGFGLALAVSYLALRSRMLTRSGAAASILMGTIVFGFGGWQWAVLLLVFFYTSSSLGKSFKLRRTEINRQYAKTDRRDAGQVAANGVVAAIFVCIHLVEGGAVWPWLGFAGALAAANADTWATELGVFSSSRPRLITALRREVEPGSSGGVSLAGTAAALGGAVLIAVCALVLTPGMGWTGSIAIAIAGLAASLLDSVLGATIQAMYYCPTDKRETEQHPFHACGTPTSLLRGLPWFNNDWVNGACTTTGALLAWGLGAALHAF